MSRQILLAHGGGGRLMRELVEGGIVPALGKGVLERLEDSAVVGEGIVVTTDSYVVKPLFFPGGDIGRLAVSGTVNDLAVTGGKPLYLTFALIIEEGFEVEALERIVASVRQTADEAGAEIVTGDTKVVERGAADGLFINTAGVGRLLRRFDIGSVRPGDKVIVNGPIGEHGLAVMSLRANLGFEGELKSDAAPLFGMVEPLLRSGLDIRFMRDPTRGGVAACLNELAQGAGVGVVLQEESLPVTAPVRAACELLGLDPLYAANEGKVIVVASADCADEVVRILALSPYGRAARIIGEVVEDAQKLVILRTRIGGERIVDMPYGEELPRIC